jgi:CheY-like chemotaxis protein
MGSKPIVAKEGAVVGGRAAASLAPREGPVVIVDDDPYDAELSEGVVQELEPRFPVQILSSGEQFVAYLQGEEPYHDRTQYPLPGLVLLDLKMPRMDGFAVLEWLQAHPEHAGVPIVVLSCFVGMVAQVTKAYGQGAHAFLTKPILLRDIQGILSLLKISI